MLGCTSPPSPLVRLALRRAECNRGLRRLWCWLIFCTSLGISQAGWAQSAVDDRVDVQLRVEWGGGARTLWQGRIRLVDPANEESNSNVSPNLQRLRLLGIEADEVGSMWLEGGESVVIKSRSPRAYDGFDISVTGSPSARLVVELSSQSQDPDAVPVEPLEIPLAQVLHEFTSRSLDDSGNRLLVRRMPGDKLRFRTRRAGMLYQPGEPLEFSVVPHLLNLPDQTPWKIDVTLRAAGSSRILVTESKEYAGDQGPAWPEMPIGIESPETEGVYELSVVASATDFRARLGLKPVLAERTVQFVVLSEQPPDDSETKTVQWTLENEIDPANTSWWKRFTSIPIPGLTRRPLASGDFEIREHPLGRIRQLGARTAGREPSWEALPVPVNKPGWPYLLEVEYPYDLEQTLGISVVEPDASGAVMPIGLDSGVAVNGTSTAGSKAWRRHRLIFWPRTKTPLVLLTNLHPERPAAFGKIRILRGPEHLPPAFARQKSDGRAYWAYLHKPLFAENFSAPDHLDPWSGRSLDDWQTMYQGATRLVEYLRHDGRTGLMMTVMTDGSSVYPSQMVQPTPRYDTGVFFSTAADPVRKDVLELLLQLFDREQLEFVPALNFSAPLDSLEQMVRSTPAERSGLEWINAKGQPWRLQQRDSGNVGAYYNVLDARVQENIRQVVGEVVQKCQSHASWKGLALHLSPDGFMLLPQSPWGMDDATMARFTADTGIAVPPNGPDRFARRAELLTRTHRQTWLKWRATAFSDFLISLANDVTTARPGAKLFLSTAQILEAPGMAEQLRPTLPNQVPLEELLLERGLDAERLRKTPGLVLLEPHTTGPLHSLKTQGSLLDLPLTESLARFGGDGATLAPLFFHPPQKVRLESFDVQSPYPNSFAWLVAQSSLDGAANRQRFVRRLAQGDVRQFIDGGWLMPLGQEDATRNLLHAFRQLPAGKFQQLSGTPQPLTIRTRTADGKVYVYVLNNAPWVTEASIGVRASAGCRIEGLLNQVPVPPLVSDSQGVRWRLTLQPYDMVAARFSQDQVELFDPQVVIPDAAVLALEERVNDLAARTATLRNPAPINVLANANFEQEPEEDRQAPFWTVSTGSSVSGELKVADAQQGQRYFEFSSQGMTASLVSSSFDVPASGRVSVAVWLRLPPGGAQPPLRLALDGRVRGQEFYRHVLVGQGREVPRIATTWAQYVFQVPDLPLDGATTIRVRFDLMGAGEVHIDNVQLYDLAFRQKELIELSKLITLASVKLQHREVSDCLMLLDGYWPRFLARHVPPSAQAVAMKPNRDETPDEPEPPPTPPSQEAEKPGFFDRLKGYVPRFMRF